MIGRYPGQVVRTVCVLMAPLIMVFGLYVIAHGHYGPGGGFAGGIVVGVGVILLRLTVDRDLADRWFPPAAGPVAAALSVLVFLMVGFAPMLVGEPFLDYAAFDVAGLSDAEMRYLGILVVELAIGIAVTGIMMALFDALSRSHEPVAAEGEGHEREGRS